MIMGIYYVYANQEDGRYFSENETEDTGWITDATQYIEKPLPMEGYDVVEVSYRITIARDED
jgi:hypothetical protein